MSEFIMIKVEHKCIMCMQIPNKHLWKIDFTKKLFIHMHRILHKGFHLNSRKMVSANMKCFRPVAFWPAWECISCHNSKSIPKTKFI